MKFVKVTIQNYRSIEELEVDLSGTGDLSCKILAGINETGKSNILNALSLLDKSVAVSYPIDVNKKAKSKGESKEIKVLYLLDPTNHQFVSEHLSSLSVSEEIINAIKLKEVYRVVEIHTDSTRSDPYHVYLESKPNLDSIVFDVTNKQFLPVSEIPAEQTPPEVPQEEGVEPSSNETKYIALDTKESWEEVLEDYFCAAIFETRLPRVINWEYDQRHLINEPVNLTSFAADPKGESKPLHNVFNLAGYTDSSIASVIEEALQDGASLGELADKLQLAATNYLKEVWPEHKVDIKVHPDNPTISFQITERDNPASGRFGINQRSDGFKHFFAILLNLAAENTTSQLEDCLILLDEPEVHLHPSGARFLRDELLKISQKNMVVYSTHSVFMIDTLCLGRHYKVQKVNEATEIIQIDESNPFKEELVFEALGTSVFNLISENNLLFEGLTDKKMFDTFTTKFKIDIRPKDINTMSVDGEGHFKNFCKFFNRKNVNVRGYILADSDSKGSAAVKNIIADHSPAYSKKNTWEINDIIDTGKASTLEDLLPRSVLEECINTFGNVTILLDPTKTFSEQIKDYNKSNAKKIDEQRLKEYICDYICSDITKSKTTRDGVKLKYPDYVTFVTSLHKKLK